MKQKPPESSVVIFQSKALRVCVGYFPASSPVDAEEVLAWIDDNTQSFVLSLNDDSFEHETQASTGATTGDWFVRL